LEPVYPSAKSADKTIRGSALFAMEPFDTENRPSEIIVREDFAVRDHRYLGIRHKKVRRL
jgi:hypothetical protein